MNLKRGIVGAITGLIALFGGVAVASPAYAASDGDLYGCASDIYDAVYCTWGWSPHVGKNPNWKINVWNMRDCYWYNFPSGEYGLSKSQANTTGYWLQAQNGKDGGTAIIYGHTGPTAMTTYWWNLLRIRRIPAGATHC